MLLLWMLAFAIGGHIVLRRTNATWE
jgi:hypothetical protein